MVNNEGNWNFNFLFDNMLNNITNRNITLPIPNEDDGPLDWRDINTNHYIVQSDYNLIYMDCNHTNFWLDKWGHNNTHLINVASASLVNFIFIIKDMVDNEGNWNSSFLFDNI